MSKNKARSKANIKKKIIIIVLCLFFLVINTTFIFFALMPSIELKGEEVVYVNIDSEYKESGYKATYQGKDVSNSVKIEGKIDTSKEGSYELEYIIKEGLFKAKKKRVINVKDLLPPEIELEGGNEVYLCENSTYEELGYKAIDNKDGDVTSNVKVEVNQDEVIYTVKDNEGNEQKVIRNLIYKDILKPTLKLKGNSTYTIYQNSTYKDPGYEVSDNCDKNISSKVKVNTSNVNTKKVGSYEVTYEVTDESGNKETMKRTVKVISRPIYPKGGTIYLTFDDGPLQGTTNVILDILKEEGVKATFFVTSSGPDSLIKREAQEGHTVALHTSTHNYAKIYKSTDAYFNDLKIIHDRVERITGIDSKIIRFPGGSSNTVSRSYCKGIMSTLTKEVVNRGYHYFDWNVDSNDAGGANSSNQVYNNVINGLSKSNYNVVLMHDIKPQTRDALRNIIKFGKEHEFTFAAIDMSTPMIKHGVNN